VEHLEEDFRADLETDGVADLLCWGEVSESGQAYGEQTGDALNWMGQARHKDTGLRQAGWQTEVKTPVAGSSWCTGPAHRYFFTPGSACHPGASSTRGTKWQVLCWLARSLALAGAATCWFPSSRGGRQSRGWSRRIWSSVTSAGRQAHRAPYLL